MAKFTLAFLALALSVARSVSAAPSAAGFVAVNGTKFTLDGEPYTVVGCVW